MKNLSPSISSFNGRNGTISKIQTIIVKNKGEWKKKLREEEVAWGSRRW